jgi:hypothetical protein
MPSLGVSFFGRVKKVARPMPRQAASACHLPERAAAATTCGGEGSTGFGVGVPVLGQVVITVGALSRGKRECTYFRGRSGEKFTAEQILITRIPAGGFHS